MKAERILQGMLVFCGLLGLIMLVTIIGWRLSAQSQALIDIATNAICKLFILVIATQMVLTKRIFQFVREHRVEVLLSVALILEGIYGDNVSRWLRSYVPSISASGLTLVFLALNQLVIVGVLALKILRHIPLLQSKTLNPGMVMVMGFAFMIFVGTLLLKSPHATQKGIGWVDALFISTSAVCVTGLSSIDISTTLTLNGQWMLLGLIQAGGLGVMTLTYFFAYFLSGDMTLRSRIGLQDMLSEDNLTQIGTVLALMIGFTALVEISGAMMLHAALRSAATPLEGLVFFSIFHSVSAFCNAGFSTLGQGLADPRVSWNTGLLSVIMSLIVLGGLGFPVVKNLWDWVMSRIRIRIRLTTQRPIRLTVNSRIVLLTTFLLLVLGAIFIWLSEFALGQGTSNGNSLFTAFFHSVTARTAGFNITPVSKLMPASAVIVILLMFAGGSPASTAGGIKTSTLAVAFLSLKRVLLGRKEIEAFGRRFSDELANRALAIILVAAIFLAIASVALCMLHPELSAMDLLFEATSALGTVGLSRDITPLLKPSAKLVLVLTMFIGRVGVLTFVISFLPRPTPPTFRFPETNIVIN